MMISKDHIEYLVGEDEVPFIRILDGEYAGVCVTLGSVSFPDEDQPILRFDYNIIEGNIEDVSKFVQALGDFIVELIQERLAAQELIFKNGTD